VAVVAELVEKVRNIGAVHELELLLGPAEILLHISEKLIF
jgi:hypothetical protein